MSLPCIIICFLFQIFHSEQITVREEKIIFDSELKIVWLNINATICWRLFAWYNPKCKKIVSKH